MDHLYQRLISHCNSLIRTLLLLLLLVMAGCGAAAEPEAAARHPAERDQLDCEQRHLRGAGWDAGTLVGWILAAAGAQLVF